MLVPLATRQLNDLTPKIAAAVKAKDAKLYLALVETRGTLTSEPYRVADRTEWLFLKRIVEERDHHRCSRCSAQRPNVQLQCAHRIARKNGGDDEPRNLTTLCLKCHEKEHPWMFKYQQKKQKDPVSAIEILKMKRTLSRVAMRSGR